MENPNALNNQFLDEDDAFYQMMTDYEEADDNDSSSDDIKDFEYKVTSDTNLYRYLKAELQIIEPSRSKITFKEFSDEKTTYQGIVLKEIDKDNFIFLLTKPEKKMKKFDINNIEVII